MDSARGGYTIIEVFIVLAVSGVMLFSAMTLFGGKQRQAEFNQAMQDIDSKINTYVNDVGVSVFPAANDYECLRNTSVDRPYLRAGSQVTGSNQDCIFLGKALQISPGSNTVTVYSVLGNRTYDAGGGQRAPVTTFGQTRPEPTVDDSGSIIASLVESYKLAYNAGTLVKSWINSDPNLAANQNYDMAGFYNSLQASAPAEQGSQSLLVKTYRAGGSAGVKPCIEEQGSCAAIFESPESWSLCFRNSSGNDFAILAITATPAGVQTQLTFKPDPTICPG